MAEKIVIYGAGGFGREVLQIIKDINAASKSDAWMPVGFLVDQKYIKDDLINGLPILGSAEWLASNKDVKVIVALGSPSARKKITENIRNIVGDCFATLVHPRAWIGDFVKIGTGSVICAGTLITTNIQIGQHVHVNIGSTIGHDAVLCEYSTLNPSVNVSGNVTIGTGCEIGTGSILIPYANVDEWSIIGAGSVVTKSLPPNITAIGAPAKVIKQREMGWQN